MPPTVQAGAPVGTPDIVGALRGQQRIGERSRKKQEMWQGLQGEFGGPTTQGPIQHIDWGNILGRGASAYMAAKEGKTADVAENKADSIQREFFSSVMQGDQEGSRLVQMAQMGVPGADQALASHLNPKKEALAGMIQGLTSGALSREMAAELAPRYGLSPQVAGMAADYARQRQEKMMGREEDLKKDIATMGIQGRLDAAQIAADAKAAGRGPDHIPAGTENTRNKKLFELDDSMQQIQATDYKFDDLLKRLESDPSAFSDNWAIKEAISGSQIPGISQLADRMMSPNQILLRNIMMDEALNKLATMSGAVSNYEMQQIRASLPTAILNRESAVEMVKKLNEWRKNSIAAMKLKRIYLQTYGFRDDRAQDMDFYGMAKSGVTPEQFGAQMEGQKSTRSAPPSTGRGQELIDQFESEAEEMGF
jgi:hypothetical protein